MGLTLFVLLWCIFIMHSWLYSIPVFLVLTLVVSSLIYYLNKTNRKIAFFFEAIENEDTALFFPDERSSPTLRTLNRNLDRVNAMIQKIKMENRAQEQYYNKIFNQVATGILTKDERGFIYLANKACKQMLNRKQLTHIKQISSIDLKLYQILDKIRPNDRQLVNLHRKDGTLHLLLHATGFKTPDQELTIVTIQDIKNELDYKELDSWIKLIRVLTHEIINTVSPITSLSESIYQRFDDYSNAADTITLNREIIDKSVEGLQVIKERGEGLIEFVNSYRRLTKLPKPQKTSLNVRNLIDKLIILVSGEPHFNRVVFKQNVDPENLEIYADEKLITHALINLIKNAIEALRKQENGQIVFTAEIGSSGKVHISVTDNGPGIPAEILDDIFIPFFTTKENGSGIGLSLSRQIIRLHGGTLNVKTEVGKGTSLILRL